MIGKEKRVVAIGKQLEKMITELNKRDLADIPTDKLLKLACELSDRLKAEEIPLELAEEVKDDPWDIDCSTRIDRWKI